MDDATKIRRLQEQREAIRRDIAGIRRTLAKFAPEFSREREGWMPAALLDYIEALAAQSPEDAK